MINEKIGINSGFDIFKMYYDEFYDRHIEIIKGNPVLVKNYLIKGDDNLVDSKEYLGQIVKVKMDRKLGSTHPKHGFIYMLNYGYIPNTISGDGEELDAYLVGVFEPVDTFEGKVIAIIHRLNDNDDKLVVAKEGVNYTDEQIKALTEFQERFFESVIIR